MLLVDKFVREVGLAFYDMPFTVYDFAIGDESNVEFDFLSIQKEVKRRKDHKAFAQDSLHFVHVHPDKHLRFSEQDRLCARSLNIALGFPVYFHVISMHDEGELRFLAARFINDMDQWLYLPHKFTQYFLRETVPEYVLDMLIKASRQSEVY